MRVLVVEDDERIASGLAAHLGRLGHAVDCAPTLAAGWTALRGEPFDLVLLDLGLPDGDGSALLVRLRAAPAHTPPHTLPNAPPNTLPDPHTPVLVMTARDEVASRIAALDRGADDYVTKPFDPDELAARMRALRRRAAGRSQALLQHGDLVIDPAARTVQRAGVPVALSGREFAVLQVLLEARPRVLSRQQIEAALYNFDSALDSNAIEVHVHHLRKKLGDGVIRTLRGVGYFVPEAGGG
jgi:two-component system OmpR family response regulator/two-component system response regulator QseB